MIILGQPIHRKHTQKIKRIFLFVIIIILFLFVVSCTKLEFDPKTSSLKYFFTNEDKWKQ
tara:strand:+ start:194 stop:373 length:180 start_codon:yes stop_codon:yes gene_type:complete